MNSLASVVASLAWAFFIFLCVRDGTRKGYSFGGTLAVGLLFSFIGWLAIAYWLPDKNDAPKDPGPAGASS